MIVRWLMILLLLGSAVSLNARGRARGYQPGGGTHHPHAKRHARQPKDKQPKKPSPPPATKFAGNPIR